MSANDGLVWGMTVLRIIVVFRADLPEMTRAISRLWNIPTVLTNWCGHSCGGNSGRPIQFDHVPTNPGNGDCAR